ncbi:MAG: hypothetical protein Q7R43_00105 [Candidatus Daviesbacteria bacterium]|nr:hypothetical protein [Candidatus Daviesbacteria bacterium]
MKNFKSIILPIFLNLALILYIYQGVFLLELQGDTWQYAWAYIIAYGDTLFNQDGWRNLQSSLAGSSLTFALIKDFFGLSAIAYYSISVMLKFLTVVTFYFLAKKLTSSILVSLVASLLLSASSAGVEATHWVFNMYAYIGLIFITLSILTGLDLPEKFTFKKWLMSFAFACVGVWYATMRTNGIIPLIIAWSFYKFIILRSKRSKINLIFWIVGFAVFILMDKFLLGQMETDYSQTHIIGAGIHAFQTQVVSGKYDFILSPASNVGLVILPDMTWSSFNFPKIFSFLGSKPLSTIFLPSFLIFSFFSWVLASVFPKKKRILVFALGLFWTIIVFFVSQLGPLNFSSWLSLVLTLFGGYFMCVCLFLITIKELPSNLKTLFFLSFLWSVVFLLLPEFQNGGSIFSTNHRYLATTAPAVALFMAGLIKISYSYKNNFFRVLILLVSFFMIFAHAAQTKAFFDRKAIVHNRELAAKIWQQFTQIVPNKPQYMKNDDPRVDLIGNGRAPTLWFESAANLVDRETLFETLYFGFLFRASLKYGWYVHAGTGLYYENYNDLVKDIKKNPQLLDDFYALRMENQSLVDITKEAKLKINMDIQK